MSALKLFAKIWKNGLVNFFKNTVIPFFTKKLVNPLKKLSKFILDVIVKNKYSIANDYIAHNVNKILPNTGTICNYILSAIGSFGTLISFILDLSDGTLDNFYCVIIS